MGSCCGKKKKESSIRTSVAMKPKQKPALIKASSPSKLPTNDLTQIYELPNNDYKTAEEVINSHGYEIYNEIGRGAFAVVYKAKRIRDNLIIACKIIELSKGFDFKRIKTDAKNELFILEKTNHPHIIKLYEHFIIKTADSQSVYIFMQFAEEDSLSKVIRESKPFDEINAKKLFAQIVSAVNHMHQKGIAHRDLKMGNILMRKGLNVIVSDFGLSRVSFRESKGGKMSSTHFCGTVPYMAPEVLINKKQKHKYDPFMADIWALGVILYCLLNRAYPFNDDKGIDRMLETQWRAKIVYHRQILSKPSKELDNLFTRLLEPNVHKRIVMSQLINHIWIKDQIESIENKIKSQSYH